MRLTKWTTLARKLPSPLFKLGAQAFIDYTFPRHIFIETTANCNLSCEYCPREKRKENMDFNLFKSIIDECSNYGPRSFSLHLFGEPLLYPHILEAIQYIKNKNRRHTILLTTNGTLLNRFIDDIVKLGVDKIIWSYRRNNFTDHTKAMLKKHGLIRLLLEETPPEEFKEWSKYPQVEIKHLHNYGGKIDTTKWGIKDESSDRWPCYHLFLAPAVRFNGEITICCNDPNGAESFGVYGYNLNIHNFWTSDRLNSIRDSHLSGQYKGLCVGCNSYKAYPDIFFGFQKKCGHSKN